ncbi:MAG: SCO family protein [Candidatus Thalassarchaeum sp.]
MQRHCTAILLALTLLLPGCLGDSQTELIGIEYRDPPEAPDFSLFDQNGDVFRFSDHENKVIVVAFVYTSCPDICLIISANLHYVKENLDSHSGDVVFVSVTIDPARDTVSHLSEWTEQMGYDWYHLTGSASTLQSIYRDWNVVVDNEHIAASEPPSENLVRVAVLNPDNTSMVMDIPCQGSTLSRCFEDGSKLMDYAMSSANISYNQPQGLIGEWQADGDWTWVLHLWDSSNNSWVEVGSDDTTAIEVDSDTHLAWIASDANLSMAPPGEDCNGHGWVMGSGGGAHCMCDEGYERPSDDWLSCAPKSNDTNSHGEVDPHEETLGEYEVGHSTVTYIIDKGMRKRVAYSGIYWDADNFLHDVIVLSDE